MEHSEGHPAPLAHQGKYPSHSNYLRNVNTCISGQCTSEGPFKWVTVTSKVNVPPRGSL